MHPTRSGQKRLPCKGLEARNVVQRFIKELTRYPNINADDMVLSDWFGESHLDEIIAAGSRPAPTLHLGKLAPYLERRRRAIPIDRSGRGRSPRGMSSFRPTTRPGSASRSSRG